MAEERFLVTGALGCIGAWVVRNLVRDGYATAVLDVGGNPHRLKLIMSEDELARVQFITGDITDLATVEAAVKDSGATRLIHLAALQVPFCRADPALGAKVNVVGTVHMFEAAKRAGLKQLVYASSIAVFGHSEDYGEGPLAHGARLSPNTHYGVYKQANEGTAQIYWQDDGLASIGLRPYTVYGAARDQGMTSGPTKAMLAAAAGQPYHIAFGGTGVFQYTDDTAKTFVRAALAPITGAEVYNVGGASLHMREIVAAIEAEAPAAAGKVTFDDKPLPFPEAVDDAAITAALGALPKTPLAQGVRETVAIFRAALADGRVAVQ
ncbi:MAG: NAD-dependent epimerase/dehydratase family protein [Anaerolineales bacterium]|nr:NAD-dependent epimerase/dehydratase family protein [Anaerolineales bacterium]